MLVYGLSVAPREAIGVSLAAVGATAIVGAIQRFRAGEVELQTGLWFAAAGMFGAPVGAWVNGMIPEPLLLMLFAGLMAVIAVRMWRLASRSTNASPPGSPHPMADGGSTSGVSALIRSRHIRVLASMGLLTGILSGLFGVGGGFVIVPALVLVGGMPIHRAVATSLVVITLVSAAGVAAYLAAGRPLGLTLTGLFILGGIGGMAVGTKVGRSLSGPTLQHGFAVVLLVMAVFIITQSLL